MHAEPGARCGRSCRARFDSSQSQLSFYCCFDVLVGHCAGEWLMFMDDDNYAKVHEIRTFVDVAHHTKADVCTCSNDYFAGNDPPTPDRVPTGATRRLARHNFASEPCGMPDTRILFDSFSTALVFTVAFLQRSILPIIYRRPIRRWERRLGARVIVGPPASVADDVFSRKKAKPSHPGVHTCGRCRLRNPRPTIRACMCECPSSFLGVCASGE